MLGDAMLGGLAALRDWASGRERDARCVAGTAACGEECKLFTPGVSRVVCLRSANHGLDGKSSLHAYRRTKSNCTYIHDS